MEEIIMTAGIAISSILALAVRQWLVTTQKSLRALGGWFVAYEGASKF